MSGGRDKLRRYKITEWWVDEEMSWQGMSWQKRWVIEETSWRIDKRWDNQEMSQWEKEEVKSYLLDMKFLDVEIR